METAQDLFDALNRGLSQNGRLLKLDTTLGKNIVLPHRLVAEDRLGRGYDYQLDVLTLKKDIELRQLIAQPVTLWIQQVNRQDYLPVHGYVHRAARLGHDGEFTACQLAFSSWLHFLNYRKDARIWQDNSADNILQDVFNHHPQAHGRFRFDLERPAVSRSYCTQYETDRHFVMRLMEEEGWYCYHEQQADGKDHTLVITDTVRNLPRLTPGNMAFHRAGSNDDVNKITQWRSSRRLTSTRLSTVTSDYKAPRYSKNPVRPVPDDHGALPEQLDVFEYSGAYSYRTDEQGERQTDNTVEEWASGAERFHATSGVRRLAVGHCFDLEGHTVHQNDPPHQREFFVIGLKWFIENNLPRGTVTTDFPGSLQQQIAAVKEETAQKTAGYGGNANAGANTGAGRNGGAGADTFRAGAGSASASASASGHDDGSGFCINHIEVQRRSREYRSPREHPRPVMHPQTATVAGPENEEIYTDELNRIRIKFIWDRLNPGNEAASCRVRVSYPGAGNDYGALHVPRIGQEVIVTFLDGNPDRPVVTGHVYNGSQTPPWHTDGKLSGVKSKEYKGSGYNQLVMDDNTGQNRVQLYSSNTHAQLNLGYLVGQKGNERQTFYGSGFALNTTAYGAVTAGQGLYLSTYRKPGATGSQLEVSEAHQQLEAGHALTKALSDTAVKAGAEALDGQEALRQFTGNTQDKYSSRGQEQASRFKEPIFLAASPAGIALTTPESTHISSGEHITLSSGHDINLAAGKSWAVSVAEKISLFVYNAGMKLCAARGKIAIQAQSDAIDMTADKTITMTSVNGGILLKAGEFILFQVGSSFYRMTAGGIVEDAKTFTVQSDNPSFVGAKGSSVEMPKFDVGTTERQFTAHFSGDKTDVAPDHHYQIKMKDGQLTEGITDALGKTKLAEKEAMHIAELKIWKEAP